jgi:hypothetical protein
MFKFIGTLLLVALAFSVGVFAEHDFGVVQLARNEMVQRSALCDCKGKCDCCPGCPGQGSEGKCTCNGQCTCCTKCVGHRAATGLVPHRCTCGCEQGKPCQCANCSVGCGFLPEPVAKPKE